MPWLLASPGHQQPWYWLCRKDRSLSYPRRNFNYLCYISVEEWQKCKYMFMFSLKTLARKGLSLLYTGDAGIFIYQCAKISTNHSLNRSLAHDQVPCWNYMPNCLNQLKNKVEFLTGVCVWLIKIHGNTKTISYFSCFNNHTLYKVKVWDLRAKSLTTTRYTLFTIYHWYMKHQRGH